MQLLCKIANALKINIDYNLLRKVSRCIASPAKKHHNPCSIRLSGASCKTARPHTPGPILICKRVHKDNEVDVIKRLCQLIREELTDPWASFRRSCLMDVIIPPQGKVFADNLSDWLVSGTVAN